MPNHDSVLWIPPHAWDDLDAARASAATLAAAILPTITARLKNKPSLRAVAAHGGPWAEIPFEFADGDPFNVHPHFNVAIQDNFARVQITVPHKAHSYYWKRVQSWSQSQWVKVAGEVQARLTRVCVDTVYWEPVLTLHVQQRRFRHRRDPFPYRDGYLIVDLDTAQLRTPNDTHPAAFVLAWLDSFVALVNARRAGVNVELGFAARFPRHAVDSACHSPDFPNALADAAVALEPFVDLLRKP